MQRLHSGLKLAPMNAMHCSGQRGDYMIGNDMFRPKKSAFEYLQTAKLRLWL